MSVEPKNLEEATLCLIEYHIRAYRKVKDFLVEYSPQERKEMKPVLVKEGWPPSVNACKIHIKKAKNLISAITENGLNKEGVNDYLIEQCAGKEPSVAVVREGWKKIFSMSLEQSLPIVTKTA